MFIETDLTFEMWLERVSKKLVWVYFVYNAPFIGSKAVRKPSSLFRKALRFTANYQGYMVCAALLYSTRARNLSGRFSNREDIVRDKAITFAEVT